MALSGQLLGGGDRSVVAGRLVVLERLVVLKRPVVTGFAEFDRLARWGIYPLPLGRRKTDDRRGPR
jgi:hypothetical protein